MRVTKERLTFEEIQHLHGKEFEDLCALYDEQDLWDILQSGAEWDFWPENVIMHMSYAKDPDGVPEMVQLSPETMEAIKESGGDIEFVEQ